MPEDVKEEQLENNIFGDFTDVKEDEDTEPSDVSEQEDGDKEEEEKKETQEASDNNQDTETEDHTPGSKTPPENLLAALQEERGRNRELRDRLKDMEEKLDILSQAINKETTEEEGDKKQDDLDLNEITDEEELYEKLPEKFNAVVKAVKKVMETVQKGSKEEQDLSLYISEQIARSVHNDYDDTVYNSGFFNIFQNALTSGDKAAMKIWESVSKSPQPAEAMYKVARKYIEKTKQESPVVDEVLNVLGITKEQYQEMLKQKQKGNKTQKAPKTLSNIQGSGEMSTKEVQGDEDVFNSVFGNTF